MESNNSLHEVVYRAGMIPWIVNETGDIEMMFMVPTSPYVDPIPQIAKGRLEPGETASQAGIREAAEELGLNTYNMKSDVVDMGTYMGRTTIFHVAVYDKTTFDKFSDETLSVHWYTLEQFKTHGRELHIHVVEEVVENIKAMVENCTFI